LKKSKLNIRFFNITEKIPLIDFVLQFDKYSTYNILLNRSNKRIRDFSLVCDLSLYLLPLSDPFWGIFKDIYNQNCPNYPVSIKWLAYIRI